jgi:SAM-dependent methyltransferase
MVQLVSLESTPRPRPVPGRARAALASLALALGLGAALIPNLGCKRSTGAASDPGDFHYDDKQAALARFEEPERDAWAMPGRVVELLQITPSMDIADIGAGSGYFTRRLATAARSGTTYAVDVEAYFKSHIERHRAEWGTPNIVTRLAVYEHPLLPRESVDLVFISNTYSFLQNRANYFATVYRALRPRGRLVVIDWRDDVDCPRALGCPKPRNRVPASTAIAELEGVGFVVLERHEFLRYQYFVVLGRAVDRNAEPPPPDPTAEPTPDLLEPEPDVLEPPEPEQHP